MLPLLNNTIRILCNLAPNPPVLSVSKGQSEGGGAGWGVVYFLSHARFARVHRELREKQPFPPIGRYRLEEKFSAPQAQKDFKPEKFAEGMSLSLQSASLRLERNFTLCGLRELCVRHLFIWLRRRRAVNFVRNKFPE